MCIINNFITHLFTLYLFQETVQIEGADSVISNDKSNTDKKANLKEISK